MKYMEQATNPLTTETTSETNGPADKSRAEDNPNTETANPYGHAQAPQNPPQRFGRLTRGEGPISGVSGGLAEYFGVDPTLVRLAMVAGTIIGGPTVPIAYIAAWIIIPEDNPAPVAPIMSAPITPPPPAPVPPAPLPHPDAPAPSDAVSDAVSDVVSDAPVATGPTPPAP